MSTSILLVSAFISALTLGMLGLLVAHLVDHWHTP
jgi:hypothetical protein